MLKIAFVADKTTQKGDPYKSLKFENGKFANMFSDDPDFDIALPGAELDRVLVQDGNYTNLGPKGHTQGGGKDQAQLTVIYMLLKRIAKHVGIEDLPEEKKPSDTVAYPEDDINPEEIPF